MIVLLIIIFVVSALLLSVIIIIQDDQGEGLGGIFGGGSSTAFGSRSGNVLTKVTSVLSAIFLVTALGVAWLNRSTTSEDIEAKARIKTLEERENSDWYVKTDESEPVEPKESEAVEEVIKPSEGTSDKE